MEPEPLPIEPAPTPDTTPPRISDLIPALQLPPPVTPASLPDSKTFDSWVEAQLANIGMSRRERGARAAMVPPEIQARMPVEVVQLLQDGVLPTSGFGLCGGIGKGKTMALAALLRVSIARFGKTAPLPLPLPTLRAFCWCSWPEEAAWMSAHADMTESRVERLSTVPVLILDDLGRERVKGSYSDDWPISRLDIVVSRRNRECLPTLWTSNLDLDGLKALYGGSMVSRLTQDNPLIWLD